MSEAVVMPLPIVRPLVLVSVGTDHHPFDRLVRWADAWAAAGGSHARVLVQTGTSSPPNDCEWEPYLDRERIDALTAECAAFVCHGGPGTIADARRAGHVPIVIPRRHALGEHVDDHQVRFCARVAQSGYIASAEDEDEFRHLLDDAVHGDPAFRIPVGRDAAPLAAARFGVAADIVLAARAARRGRRHEPELLIPHH